MKKRLSYARSIGAFLLMWVLTVFSVQATKISATTLEDITGASAGDTVEFPTNEDILLSSSITLTKPITINGNGNSLKKSKATFFLTIAANVSINNLKLNGNSLLGKLLLVDPGDTLTMDGKSFITGVKNGSTIPVQISGTLIGGIISGNTTASASILSLETNSSVINTLIYGNTAGQSTKTKPVVDAKDNSRVINCTIADNTGKSGLNTVSTAYVANSIIYGNNSSDVTGTMEIMNYCAYGSTSLTDNGTGNVMLSSSPFADNYSLDSEKTGCIDEGINDACSVATDLAGKPRVSGDAIDMGCYEYISLNTCLTVSASKSSDLIYGETVQLKLDAIASPAGDDLRYNVTFQWEKKVDGEWQAIAGATDEDNYSFVFSESSATKYRLKVTKNNDSENVGYSNEISLTAQEPSVSWSIEGSALQKISEDASKEKYVYEVKNGTAFTLKVNTVNKSLTSNPPTLSRYAIGKTESAPQPQNLIQNGTDGYVFTEDNVDDNYIYILNYGDENDYPHEVYITLRNVYSCGGMMSKTIFSEDFGSFNASEGTYTYKNHTTGELVTIDQYTCSRLVSANSTDNSKADGSSFSVKGTMYAASSNPLSEISMMVPDQSASVRNHNYAKFTDDGIANIGYYAICADPWEAGTDREFVNRDNGFYDHSSSSASEMGGVLMFNGQTASSVLYERQFSVDCEDAVVTIVAYLKDANQTRGVGTVNFVNANVHMLIINTSTNEILDSVYSGDMMQESLCATGVTRGWNNLSTQFKGKVGVPYAMQLIIDQNDNEGKDILIDDISISMCYPSISLSNLTTSNASSMMFCADVDSVATIRANVEGKVSDYITNPYYLFQYQQSDGSWENINASAFPYTREDSCSFNVKRFPSGTKMRVIIAKNINTIDGVTSYYSLHANEANELDKYPPLSCGFIYGVSADFTVNYYADLQLLNNDTTVYCDGATVSMTANVNDSRTDYKWYDETWSEVATDTKTLPDFTMGAVTTKRYFVVAGDGGVCADTAVYVAKTNRSITLPCENSQVLMKPDGCLSESLSLNCPVAVECGGATLTYYYSLDTTAATPWNLVADASQPQTIGEVTNGSIVYWKVTTDQSESATCEQTIEVLDVEAPTFSCDQIQTDTLDVFSPELGTTSSWISNVDITSKLNGVDNCSANPILIWNTDGGDVFEDYDSYGYLHTLDAFNQPIKDIYWSLRDEAGNHQGYCKQTLMVRSYKLDTTVCSCDLPLYWHNQYFEGPATRLVPLGKTGLMDTLVLNVFPSVSQTQDVYICDGETYEWNNTTLDTQGKYVKNLKAANGCDSIVTLNLYVKQEGVDNIDIEIACGSWYVWHGDTIRTSGFHTKEITPESKQCQFNETLALTLYGIEKLQTQEDTVTVCNDGTTFSITPTVNSQQTNYAWYNASTGMKVGTDLTFTDTKSMTDKRYYFVAKTSDGLCVDTAYYTVTMDRNLEVVCPENATLDASSAACLTDPVVLGTPEVTICTGSLSTLVKEYKVDDEEWNLYSGAMNPLSLADGSVVTWRVTMDGTVQKTCTQMITVKDVTSPTISLKTNASYLIDKEVAITNQDNGEAVYTVDPAAVLDDLTISDNCSSDLADYTVYYSVGGAYTALTSSAQRVLNVLNNTSEEILWKVNDKAGNESNVISQTISVKPVSLDTSVCQTPVSVFGSDFISSGTTGNLTLTINILPTTTGNVDTLICSSSLPLVWHGVTFNEAGSAQFVTENQNGCDSIVTMTVQIVDLPRLQGDTLELCLGESATLSTTVDAQRSAMIWLDKNKDTVKVGQSELAVTMSSEEDYYLVASHSELTCPGDTAVFHLNEKHAFQLSCSSQVEGLVDNSTNECLSSPISLNGHEPVVSDCGTFNENDVTLYYSLNGETPVEYNNSSINVPVGQSTIDWSMAYRGTMVTSAQASCVQQVLVKDASAVAINGTLEEQVLSVSADQPNTLYRVEASDVLSALNPSKHCATDFKLSAVVDNVEYNPLTTSASLTLNAFTNPSDTISFVVKDNDGYDSDTVYQIVKIQSISLDTTLCKEEFPITWFGTDFYEAGSKTIGAVTLNVHSIALPSLQKEFSSTVCVGTEKVLSVDLTDRTTVSWYNAADELISTNQSFNYTVGDRDTSFYVVASSSKVCAGDTSLFTLKIDQDFAVECAADAQLTTSADDCSSVEYLLKLPTITTCGAETTYSYQYSLNNSEWTNYEANASVNHLIDGSSIYWKITAGDITKTCQQSVSVVDKTAPIFNGTLGQVELTADLSQNGAASTNILASSILSELNPTDNCATNFNLFVSENGTDFEPFTDSKSIELNAFTNPSKQVYYLVKDEQGNVSDTIEQTVAVKPVTVDTVVCQENLPLTIQGFTFTEAGAHSVGEVSVNITTIDLPSLENHVEWLCEGDEKTLTLDVKDPARTNITWYDSSFKVIGTGASYDYTMGDANETLHVIASTSQVCAGDTAHFEMNTTLDFQIVCPSDTVLRMSDLSCESVNYTVVKPTIISCNKNGVYDFNYKKNEESWNAYADQSMLVLNDGDKVTWKVTTDTIVRSCVQTVRVVDSTAPVMTLVKLPVLSYAVTDSTNGNTEAIIEASDFLSQLTVQDNCSKKEDLKLFYSLNKSDFAEFPDTLTIDMNAFTNPSDTLYCYVEDESGNASDPILQVLNVASFEMEMGVCENKYPFSWFDQEFEKEGVVKVGAAVLTTTTNPIYSVDTAAFAYDYFKWYNQTYPKSGKYQHVLTSVAGCDSVINLKLVINSTASVEDIVYAGECYEWHNKFYCESGVYFDTLKSVEGNDSIAKMYLTIKKPEKIYSVDCYEWQSRNICESGIYVDSLLSIDGLDSVVAINFTRLEAQKVYASECYRWRGSSFCESGRYTFNDATIKGADSIIAIDLTILGVEKVSSIGCYTWNGNIYCKTGFYTQNMKTTKGADSIVSLDLTVIAENKCYASDCYTYYEKEYCESGIYYDTVLSTLEVDSVVMLDLTIMGVETIYTSTCYTWNDSVYCQDGKYSQSFKNSNGGDSVVTKKIQILDIETIYACESYTWNGKKYTESGDYTQTLQSVAGTDSIVTIHLLVGAPSITNLKDTILLGESYDKYGFTKDADELTKVKTYEFTQTLENLYGCDSIVQLALTIYEKDVVIANVKTKAERYCATDLVTLLYTLEEGEPFTYEVIFDEKAIEAGFQNIVKDVDGKNIEFAIPDGMKAGTYSATLQLKGQVKESERIPFTVTVNLSDDYITKFWSDVVVCDNSNNQFVAYQWYYNGQLIEGATDQYYTQLGGLNGTYSVKVETVDGETLYVCAKHFDKESVPFSVVTYPNPAVALQDFTVEVKGLSKTQLQDARLFIYNEMGVMVYKQKWVEKTNKVSLPSGQYIALIVLNNDKTASCKLQVK